MKRSAWMFHLVSAIRMQTQCANSFSPSHIHVGASTLRHNNIQHAFPFYSTPSLFATTPSSSSDDNNNNNTNTVNFLKQTLRNLAQLSLADYEWRRDAQAAAQADRMLERSVARMRGQDPAYVRPMDAPVVGPLGRLEQRAAHWFADVVREEGARAAKIVRTNGDLLRPMDNYNGAPLGPLGILERTVVNFIEKIKASELLRKETGVLRPKDLQADARGPLGDMEEEAVRILTEIKASEELRAEQSRLRGGEIVRPIDVPGPLGDFEMKVAELFRAEQRRAAEREAYNGRIVRPKDAKIKGPLGEAEFQAYETIKQLNAEEMERLRSIRLVLEEKRPMQADSKSPLGILETFFVGLVRAPQMVASVLNRVGELLRSETLSGKEERMLKLKSKGKLNGSDNNGERTRKKK
jgi:hypothetical protein